jgi:hypothetical protein
MRTRFVFVVLLTCLSWVDEGQSAQPKEAAKAEAGIVTSHSDGLHGYIGFSAARPPAQSEYSAGMGFYWSAEKRAKLQAFVETIHATWPIDRDYMAPLRHGELVSLDPALLVTPPTGLETGYVPIVTGQYAP